MSRLRPSAIPRLFSSKLEIVAPSQLRFPPITASMDKGGSLTSLLDDTAVRCLAHNLALAWPRFDAARFRRSARRELDALSIMQRGLHLARILRQHLPPRYEDAVAVLLRSLPPPDSATSDRGLGVFFFLPHTSFIALYGLDAEHNAGVDPFPVSMHAQYELTRRSPPSFPSAPSSSAGPSARSPNSSNGPATPIRTSAASAPRARARACLGRNGFPPSSATRAPPCRSSKR